MKIFLYNPLNVDCAGCGVREGSYCIEHGEIKAGFHPIRVAEINDIVNEGFFSEGSNLSRLAHYFYQGEKDANFRRCLEEAWELLSSTSADKIEILMVLIDEGFAGSKDDLLKVINLI